MFEVICCAARIGTRLAHARWTREQEICALADPEPLTLAKRMTSRLQPRSACVSGLRSLNCDFIMAHAPVGQRVGAEAQQALDPRPSNHINPPILDRSETDILGVERGRDTRRSSSFRRIGSRMRCNRFGHTSSSGVALDATAAVERRSHSHLSLVALRKSLLQFEPEASNFGRMFLSATTGRSRTMVDLNTRRSSVIAFSDDHSWMPIFWLTDWSEGRVARADLRHVQRRHRDRASWPCATGGDDFLGPKAESPPEEDLGHKARLERHWVDTVKPSRRRSACVAFDPEMRFPGNRNQDNRRIL